MATISINGKEYPVPEEFTMGELADIEEITGQGYDLAKTGIKGMLAIAYIAARRKDPSVTIDDLRQLKPGQISAENGEEELTSPPPIESGESKSLSAAPSVNGSAQTLDETREPTGAPV